MSGFRFKLIGPDGEIDGGMLVVKDTHGNVLVTIYQPTTTNADWNSSNVYYCKTGTAWPSDATTLGLSFSPGPPSSNAGFKAFAPQKFGAPVDSPTASTTLFVASDQTWGFDMSGLTGTGSTTEGNAVWWNTVDGPIAISNPKLSNDNSLSAGTACSATDSPSS